MQRNTLGYQGLPLPLCSCERDLIVKKGVTRDSAFYGLPYLFCIDCEWSVILDESHPCVRLYQQETEARPIPVPSAIKTCATADCPSKRLNKECIEKKCSDCCRRENTGGCKVHVFKKKRKEYPSPPSPELSSSVDPDQPSRSKSARPYIPPIDRSAYGPLSSTYAQKSTIIAQNHNLDMASRAAFLKQKEASGRLVIIWAWQEDGKACRRYQVNLPHDDSFSYYDISPYARSSIFGFNDVTDDPAVFEISTFSLTDYDWVFAVQKKLKHYFVRQKGVTRLPDFANKLSDFCGCIVSMKSSDNPTRPPSSIPPYDTQHDTQQIIPTEDVNMEGLESRQTVVNVIRPLHSVSQAKSSQPRLPKKSVADGTLLPWDPETVPFWKLIRHSRILVDSPNSGALLFAELFPDHKPYNDYKLPYRAFLRRISKAIVPLEDYEREGSLQTAAQCWKEDKEIWDHLIKSGEKTQEDRRKARAH